MSLNASDKAASGEDIGKDHHRKTNVFEERHDTDAHELALYRKSNMSEFKKRSQPLSIRIHFIRIMRLNLPKA